MCRANVPTRCSIGTYDHEESAPTFVFCVLSRTKKNLCSGDACGRPHRDPVSWPSKTAIKRHAETEMLLPIPKCASSFAARHKIAEGRRRFVAAEAMSSTHLDAKVLNSDSVTARSSSWKKTSGARNCRTRRSRLRAWWSSTGRAGRTGAPRRRPTVHPPQTKAASCRLEGFGHDSCRPASWAREHLRVLKSALGC